MNNQILRKANILGKLAVFALVNTLLFALVVGAQAALAPVGAKFIGRNATAMSLNDFAGVPGVAQTNWNQINDSAPPISNVTTGPLNDSVGGVTAVTLTWSANDSWNNDGPSATANDRLMQGISKQQGVGTAAVYTFNNVPSNPYDVYVYCNVNGDGRGQDVGVGSTTNYLTEEHQFGGTFVRSLNTNPAGVRDLANYVKTRTTPDINGKITIYAVNQSVPDGNGISAIQLVFAGPVEIATQPVNQTVVQGLSTSFSAVAIGEGPISYQWYKNGSIIPGATSSTYPVINAQNGDNGATFFVVASNNAAGTPATATSSTATLTVQSVPVVASVSSLGDPNGVYVTYSRAMKSSTALDISKYSIPGLTISAATFFDPGSNVVRLAVNTMTLQASYTLTTTGVTDQGNLTIVPNPTVSSFVFGAGITARARLTLQRWDGDGNFANIKNKIATCVPPQRTNAALPSAEYGTNPSLNNGDGNTENYGAKIYGQFVAPTTGNYVFGLAADDNAELYLSTDHTPASKVLIAQQSSWGGSRDFIVGGTLGGNAVVPLTAGIPLIAGNLYYMEGLVQEGGGGDHISIAVQTPGGPAIVDGPANVIPASMFANSYSMGCPPNLFFQNLGPVAILNGAQSQTVLELASVTLRLVLDGTPAYNVQWYSNSVPVPGATGITYTFNPLRYASNASYRAVVNNGFSSATSAPSVITVISDEIPPVLVKAVGAAYRTNASVVFNEPVGIASGTTLANYTITNSAGAPLAVTAAVISTDGKVVTLRTALQTPGETYCIVVSNVVDRAGVPNPVAPGSVACFVGDNLNYAAGGVLFRAYPTGGGNNLSELRNHPSYPNSPDFFTAISGMNSRLASDPANPTFYSGDGRENYGATIAGHFIPPTSGNWIFYTSADDDGGLDMNTNGPAYSGKTQVRFAPGCCRALTAGADPTAPIAMIAGQSYYIEALYKEGGGGDYVSVGARLVGDNSTIVPIVSSRLAFGFNLITTLNPTNTTVVQNHTATFVAAATVGGAGVAPLFQWQRSVDTNGSSFTNIPGAITASYSYFAPLIDDNVQFRCAIYLPNLQTNLTTAAVLTVLVDGEPPAITSVRAISVNKIEVTFSERMQAGSPNADDANYIVSSPAGNIPVVVGSVVQSGDLLRATLSVEVAMPCDMITVALFNATDEAGNVADVEGSFFHYLPFGMKHRYSFSNPAGSANGGVLVDSVGTGDGVVQGAGASFTGSRFVLPGGGSGSAPFGDLPNYMVSTNSAANGGSGKVTVEGWVKVTGNQSWSRIFDFGDSLSSEIIGVGGGGEGKDYFFYSAQVGGDVNTRQTEVRNETAGPAGGTGGGAGVQHSTSQFNQMNHFAVTWDEAAHLIKTYENGVLVSTVGLGATMDQLNDVNVWLGRSQWNGDANMQGEYDEFRVYDRLLTTAEMAANMSIGPDANYGTLLALRLVIPSTNVFEQSPAQQMQIIGDFSNASNVNLTLSRCYALNSDNPLVATVDAGGLLSFVGIGDSTISVTVGGLTTAVVVTVNADVTPPSVVSAAGVRTFNAVKVKFSEMVEPTGANSTANYVLTDTNLNDITINAATLGADGMTVTLDIPTHAPGETYIITVYGVTDLASTPNEIATTPVTFKTWVLSCGFVYFEAFLGLSVPDYQNPQPVIDAINNGVAASFSFYTNVVNWPQTGPGNGLDNYGMHFRGLFRAPVSGSYKFEPAHDDSGNLLFSTDATEANATLAMDFDCCSGFGSGEAGYTVELVGGNSYFFDLRVVEAGGGDYAGLAVTLPGGQYLAPIPAQYLAVPTPPNGSLLITNQPANQSINLLTSGTGGATYVTVDFNANNEGFVAAAPLPTDGPWVYDAMSGSWKTAGQSADNGHNNTVTLTSPSIPVPASGSLRLSFDHRYSFESGAYDGGQVRYSINGSPFYTVPAAAFTQNGYNGTPVGGDLAGQVAFVEESAGHGGGSMITSVCDLGYFPAGASVQVQFVAASDSNTTGNQPVWEVTAGSLTIGGSSAVATFSVGTAASNAQDGANPPRFYQWYRDDGAGFVAIPGANDPRYLVGGCLDNSGAQFHVKVSIVGENAVVSDTATLTISGVVTASVNPVNICIGESGVLTAITSARSPSYYWLADGQTTASATYSPVVTTDYVVLITDGATRCTYLATGTVLVASQFSNVAANTIPASGAASTYPSTITVSNLNMLVSKVKVTLNNLSHAWSDDLEVLLVGPAGQSVHLMSDAGGVHAISGVTLTFDDAALGSLPDSGMITSGRYLPTNYDDGRADVFSSPAPAGPYGSALAAFNGSNPNGNWSLYLLDDASPDGGTLLGGWSLSIWATEPASDVQITSTAPAGVQVGSPLTFVITVNNVGPGTALNVNVQHALPVGVTFVSATASQGSAVNNLGTINAALGSINAGGSATVTVVVTPNAVGTVLNDASVTSPTDINLANNTAATTTTLVVAPLYISVNFPGGHEFGTPTTLAPGEIAGVTTLSNWNNIGGGDINSVNNAALTDSKAQATPVTIFYNTDENWGSGAGTATPDQKMLNGTLGISNDGHYRPVFLNNVPNRAYKLIMYNVQRDNQNEAYTVNGDTAHTLHITTQNGAQYNAGNTWIRGTSTNENLRDVCNYVQFDEVTPINGTITIDCRSESFRANMNGIQLVSLEPGAFRFVPQPLDTTVAEGGTATFYGNAVDGTGAVTYQWLTNGVADSVNGLTQTYTRAGVGFIENGNTFTLVATDSTSQSVTSSVAVLTVINGARLISATSDGRTTTVFARFGAAVALTGVYTLNNGATVSSVAYGATHLDVVLTTSALIEGTTYTVTATGETRDDNGAPTAPNPTSASFRQGYGRLCTDFATLPAGATLFNNGASGAGQLIDDGTGTNTVVQLTQDGINGAYGKLYISNRTDGYSINVFDAKWRTRIGGELNGHADGMSFNWANDLVANGNFIATDEGEGSGVSFTIDTWDGGSGPDTGIEIKWQQNRIAFLHIPRSFEGNANFICKDVFVDTSASVSAEGLAVFTYNGNTVSATIPGWTGIANGAYSFAARTGGENDNMWIDDLCINNFALGPVFFTVQPVNTTALEGATATFTSAVDGTPSYHYQWFSNGVPIAGAIGASYTTPAVTEGFEGSLYSVVASNGFSSVTSTNAALHVQINPRVVSVFSQKDNQVHVVYTRGVDLNSGFYEFDGGVFEISRAYGTSSNEVVITTDALTVGAYILTVTDVTDLNDALSLIFPNPTVQGFHHGYGSVCTDFLAGLPPTSSVIGSATVAGGILHLTDAVNGQSGNFFLPDMNAGYPVDRLLVKFKVLLGGGTCCGARYADGMSFNIASDFNAGTSYGEEGTGSGLTLTFDTWDNAAPDSAPALEVRYHGSVVAVQSMAGIREDGRPLNTPLLNDANGNPLSLDTSNTFVNVVLSVGPDGKLDLYFKDQIIFHNLQLPGYTPFVGANFGFGARTGGANENAWIDDLCINAFSLGGVAITQQPADVTVNYLPTPRVSFSVGVDGLPPYSVQWYSNGVPVIGATALTYTTPPLSLSASGSGYSAIIGNFCGSVTSRVAVVTITPKSANLTLVRDIAGNATISWQGAGWRLQATTALDVNPNLTVWQDQPFPSGTVIPAGYFGTGNTNVFFRLICP